MESTQIQEFVTWLIGGFFVSLVTFIGGVYAIVKSGRMIPREVKGADLKNKQAELDIVKQYDEIATMASDKTLKTQERLDKIEKDYNDLKRSNDALKENYEFLNNEYTSLREEHDVLKITVQTQEETIKRQEEEIYTLICELENARMYNDALIQQMKDKQIIPIDIKTLPLKTTGRKGKKASEDVE